MAIITYEDIQFDPGIFKMAPTGKPLVFVTDCAKVNVRGSNSLDLQKPTGQNLARVKSCGQELMNVIITWTVLPEEEIHFQKNIVPILREKGSRGNALPIDVQNQELFYFGLNTLIIKDFDAGMADLRDGRQPTIYFTEWSPLPVKPKAAAIGKLKVKPPPSPGDNFRSNAFSNAPRPKNGEL